VSNWQITSFEELLAHLDGLLEAAWNADVDLGLARQLASVRRRLVRIKGHLEEEGGTGNPAPPPRRKTLQTSEDLLAGFGEIVQAARAGNALPTTLRHYLHNALQRLTFYLRAPEHRLSSREPVESGSSAQLELDGQRLEVTLIDRSAFGMGVRADTPVDTDKVAQLHCPEDPKGPRTYECVTVHCREFEDGYHVGLEIFTSRMA